MLDLSRFVRFAAVACAAWAALHAQAQSSCSSDGRPRPVALLERFISADCEACWGDAAALRPGRGEVALDWIVPSARGDDAPLSAAATRDAQERLEVLKRAAPERGDSATHPVSRGARKLRVAHGLPFNGYVGASIELTPQGNEPLQAWLALVETVPAGADGTAVERNLVRNVLRLEWDPKQAGARRFFESRAMGIPEGANPKRLRVVGWVQDSRGRIAAAAQSVCPAKGER